MNYVIGVDLGTSAVKLLLVGQDGKVAKTVSKSYPLIHKKTGYSEQDPAQWTKQTIAGLRELLDGFDEQGGSVEGISFSGQMHGLVLLDENGEVLRPAILWNDTRTTDQCRQIISTLGQKRLLEITKNPALEGFTLPKILWVKENEPDIFRQAKTFLLPKDYLRYQLTGELHMDYSDAAGTLLLDIANKMWSEDLCSAFDIDPSLCPPLVSSSEQTGTVTPAFAKASGLPESVKVFAGGADNACGAVGAGILEEGKTLCSIGTSGVVLSYEDSADKEFGGKVHYFSHAAPGAYYTMGVTLAAGYSLSWFKETFAPEESFSDMLANISAVPPGSGGLLFAPYIAGERTPHADAVIRGSFIGMDGSHKREHFARAVLEGITFSLQESIAIFREQGKRIDTVISIGGGAKNDDWLQMQADIFNADIVRLNNEQGPGMGAAMLAAFGCGWFGSLKECADAFLSEEKRFRPDSGRSGTYRELFEIYKTIYSQTKPLNDRLAAFRQ